MVLDFDTFQLDLDRRQLLRDGEPVHVSPKALQLLQLLMEARPKALSKTEIHEHLWPATFVADSNLASIINELRRALADDARTPKYIRTVHAFGYAFCADPISSPARSSGTPVAKLVWDKGEEMLVAGRNVIGRDAGAQVCVDDRTISRHHAAIIITGAKATLEDLESKNGTFRDGERITSPVELSDGSVVDVGSVRMIYREISTLSTATHYRK
jgi:DNA-binding winged helix-turn-helix (wHTH) protein